MAAIQFPVHNRFSGATQYVAELDCDKAASDSTKLGLAVRWGYKNGADLSEAYLGGADLSGADLSGAYLSGADLSGAKWSDDITIQREPLFLSGLAWPVIILDEHMQIGCELHRLSEWAAFDERRIAGMARGEAVRFWRANKDALLALAAADGRGVTPETAEASGEAA